MQCCDQSSVYPLECGQVQGTRATATSANGKEKQNFSRTSDEVLVGE